MWNKVCNQKLYRTYIFYKRLSKFPWKFNNKRRKCNQKLHLEKA